MTTIATMTQHHCDHCLRSIHRAPASAKLSIRLVKRFHLCRADCKLETPEIVSYGYGMRGQLHPEVGPGSNLPIDDYNNNNILNIPSITICSYTHSV